MKAGRGGEEEINLHLHCASLSFRTRKYSLFVQSMSEPQIPESNHPNKKPSAEPPKIPSYGGGGNFPNPRETANPDAATLRDQWRFAIRQYSRWYSQAWGTAILAGVSFFALGWIIKGSNPLPSLQSDSTGGNSSSSAAAADKDKAVHQPR